MFTLYISKWIARFYRVYMAQCCYTLILCGSKSFSVNQLTNLFHPLLSVWLHVSPSEKGVSFLLFYFPGKNHFCWRWKAPLICLETEWWVVTFFPSSTPPILLMSWNQLKDKAVLLALFQIYSHSNGQLFLGSRHLTNSYKCNIEVRCDGVVAVKLSCCLSIPTFNVCTPSPLPV